MNVSPFSKSGQSIPGSLGAFDVLVLVLVDGNGIVDVVIVDGDDVENAEILFVHVVFE